MYIQLTCTCIWLSKFTTYWSILYIMVTNVYVYAQHPRIYMYSGSETGTYYRLWKWDEWAASFKKSRQAKKNEDWNCQTLKILKNPYRSRRGGGRGKVFSLLQFYQWFPYIHFHLSHARKKSVRGGGYELHFNSTFNM